VPPFRPFGAQGSGRREWEFWDALGVHVVQAAASDLNTVPSLAEEVEERFGPR
jgi:hypothetical protein